MSGLNGADGQPSSLPLATRLQRVPGFLVAVLLVLLLSSWFAPGGTHIHQQQVDFWLVWLLCMALLAWPLTLLELGLARRSQSTPLVALGPMTRESDSAPLWRVTGFLAVGAMGFFAGGLGHQATGYAARLCAQWWPQWPVWPLALGSVVLILLLSLRPAVSMWLGTLLAVMAIGLSSFAQGIGEWAMTPFSLSEWAQAVILALVASGLGLGVYWQTALQQASSGRTSEQAWPIWLAQLLAGGAFALAQGVHGTLATLLYTAALCCGAAYLIAVVRNQLSGRFSVVAGWLVSAGLLAVWLLPLATVWGVLASVLGLLVCLLYAIFVGWRMKISHVRKALAFDSELLYNLWRVVVRLVIPLAIVLALVGLAQTVLGRF